jgi:hypothetical protein
MYCRLARFQSALAYATPHGDLDWAQVAALMRMPVKP